MRRNKRKKFTKGEMVVKMYGKTALGIEDVLSLADVLGKCNWTELHQIYMAVKTIKEGDWYWAGDNMKDRHREEFEKEDRFIIRSVRLQYDRDEKGRRIPNREPNHIKEKDFYLTNRLGDLKWVGTHELPLNLQLAQLFTKSAAMEWLDCMLSGYKTTNGHYMEKVTYIQLYGCNV